MGLVSAEQIVGSCPLSWAGLGFAPLRLRLRPRCGASGLRRVAGQGSGQRGVQSNCWVLLVLSG